MDINAVRPFGYNGVGGAWKGLKATAVLDSSMVEHSTVNGIETFLGVSTITHLKTHCPSAQNPPLSPKAFPAWTRTGAFLCDWLDLVETRQIRLGMKLI